MANYFNTLPLRLQLEQLGTCEFMDQAEFADGVKKLEDKKVVIVGCGAQGLNQGLNMRDSGLDVSYTLREAALQKARDGVTSLEEVLRRTVAHEDSLPAYLVNPDVEEYEDGDIIIQEANKDKDFFKLVQGSVLVVKKGKVIAELSQPDEYFGEMSAISGEPRSASIVSKGRSKIKRYPGDKIMEVIQTQPKVARYLFKTLVNRLSQTSDIIVKLAENARR